MANEGQPYTSEDMKKGIDNSTLKTFVGLLKELFRLDTRGGVLLPG